MGPCRRQTQLLSGKMETSMVTTRQEYEMEELLEEQAEEGAEDAVSI